MRERAWPFVIPLYAVLAGVLALPALYSIVLGFFEYRMLGGVPRFTGLDNFREMMAHPTFRLAVWNTLRFTVSAVALEMTLGLAIAMLLNQDFRGSRLVRALAIAPWVLSPVVAGLMWRMIFHTNYGVLNYALSLLGLPLGRLDWLSTPGLAMVAVVVAEVWQNTPFVYLVLFAALQGLPQDIYEAAKVDGATSWQTFRFVTWPLLWPAMAVAMTFRIIFVFREFTIPWTVTQGGPANATLVLSIYLYRQMLNFFDLGTAAAVGVIMMVLTALLALPFLLRRAPAAQGSS